LALSEVQNFLNEVIFRILNCHNSEEKLPTFYTWFKLVTKNIRGNVLVSYLGYIQIWLNLPRVDCYLGYIKNLTKKMLFIIALKEIM
jgi:hypothetical protein